MAFPCARFVDEDTSCSGCRGRGGERVHQVGVVSLEGTDFDHQLVEMLSLRRKLIVRMDSCWI